MYIILLWHRHVMFKQDLPLSHCRVSCFLLSNTTKISNLKDTHYELSCLKLCTFHIDDFVANVFVVVNTKRITIIYSFIRLFYFNNYITCSGKFNKALQFLDHLNPAGFFKILHLDKSTKTTTASFSVPYYSCSNLLVLFLQPNFIVAIKQFKGTVVSSKIIRAFVIGITKTCVNQSFHQPLCVFSD